MIEQIRWDFSAKYPQDIVDALIDSFIRIKEYYYLGKHEPAELNGGKFVEACVRLLQYKLHGRYTPLVEPIRNIVQELRNFEQTPSTNPDSYRLHIPRVLLGVYNIRNRRGVGHLGGDVSPNLADSTLILSVSSWVMAELYRIHYAVPLDEAQRIVNDLVERKIPLVYEVKDIKRVLVPNLSMKDQTLVLLYSAYPHHLSISELLYFTEYSNPSVYRKKILNKLHRQRLINCSNDKTCVILPPGLQYVEAHYTGWLDSVVQGG